MLRKEGAESIDGAIGERVAYLLETRGRLGLVDRPIMPKDILAHCGIAPPMKRAKPKVPRKDEEKGDSAVGASTSPPPSSPSASEDPDEIPF